MDKKTSNSPSRRAAFLVAALIFAIGGIAMMLYGLAHGWGDFFDGLLAFGFSFLAYRESRKDSHVA